MRSFDVYDTILVRAYLNPREVFVAIEQRLRSEGRPPGFSKLRPAAEALAAARATKQAATFDEIYIALAEISRWAHEHVEAARAHELEEECRLYPVQHTLELVEKERSERGRVVFVSDMYLPADFIKARLLKAEAGRPDDMVIVSSAERASKHRGTLYPHLQLRWPEWSHHYGDNPHGDITMARRHGLGAELCTITRATEWEKRIRKKFPDLPGFAGAIRAARLSTSSNPASMIGAGLSGPLLHGWLQWLRESRSRDDVSTLWCAAREGELIAQACALYDPQAARLLPVSRQALRLCLYTTPADTLPEWIIDTDKRSLFSTLSNLSLNPENWLSELKSAGWETDRLDKRLNWNVAQKKGLLRFLQHPSVAQTLTKQTQVQLESALQAFKDMGVPQTGIIGFVDIGWSGTIQYLWQKVLAAGGWETTVLGYYFCLEKNPHTLKAHTYLGAKGGYHFPSHHHHVLECLLPSISGQVAGFNTSGPIHYPHTTFSPAQTGAIHASCLQFCRIAVSMGLKLPSPEHWLPGFLACPPPDLACLIGQAHFTSGSSAGLRLFRQNALADILRDRNIHIYWPEGWLAQLLKFAPTSLRAAIILPVSALFRLLKNALST